MNTHEPRDAACESGRDADFKPAECAPQGTAQALAQAAADAAPDAATQCAVQGASAQPAFPLVSIIIDNYNYAAYLAQAIDSALDQDYPNIEVIVVDDGSTDGSRDIVAAYGLRVHALYKKNGGQGSAFNAGFAASRGAIVLFLDADDVLHADAVSTVVAHWHEGLSRIQFQLRLIDPDGTDMGLYMRQALPSGDLADAIRKSINPAMPTSGNAFARSALELLLPMPEAAWRLGADGYLLWLSPFLGPVCSLPGALADYRLHADNLSSVRTGGIAARLVREISNLERIESAIRDFLAARGEYLPAGQPIWNGATGLRWRLAALVLTGRPVEGFADSAWRLGWRGMRAVLTAPTLPRSRRLIQAGWFVLVGTLPRRVARVLAGLAFGRRPVDRFQRRLKVASGTQPALTG